MLSIILKEMLFIPNSASNGFGPGSNRKLKRGWRSVRCNVKAIKHARALPRPRPTIAEPRYFALGVLLVGGVPVMGVPESEPALSFLREDSEQARYGTDSFVSSCGQVCRKQSLAHGAAIKGIDHARQDAMQSAPATQKACLGSRSRVGQSKAKCKHNNGRETSAWTSNCRPIW